MAHTYNKGMLATIGTPGIKIAQYEMTSIGTYEGLTIRAKDIGLSTIMSLGINDEVDATGPVRGFIVGIGTFTSGKGAGNYATVRAVASPGTVVTSLGTTIQIMAIGM